MSEYIQIRLLPDSDGAAELFMEYSTRGFSGRGSAWFDLNDLEKKVERFLDYPLSVDDLPSLRGGYWNQDGTKLNFEHVFLSAYPIGNLGSLALSIRCATPVADSGFDEVRCSGTAEIAITYQQLAQFAADMKHLVRARIDGSVTIQLRSNALD